MKSLNCSRAIWIRLLEQIAVATTTLYYYFLPYVPVEVPSEREAKYFVKSVLKKIYCDFTTGIKASYSNFITCNGNETVHKSFPRLWAGWNGSINVKEHALRYWALTWKNWRVKHFFNLDVKWIYWKDTAKKSWGLWKTQKLIWKI